MPFPSADENAVKTIRFIRRGEVVSLNNVPPTRTLLEVLREDLACTGTKEGCGEGDCGACTVVLGDVDPARPGALRFRAINSCIRLAHSIDGMALWTVEDIAEHGGAWGPNPPKPGPRDRLCQTAGAAAPLGGREPHAVGERGGRLLHPAQQAMLECHGSQCGFCTPGFVMSLFGMYQNHVCKGKVVTRALAQEELSGNLCRCTGYRPILEAAVRMATLPAATIDHAATLQKLEQLALESIGLEADSAYKLPRSLKALLNLRSANPGAQLVAGCTDVGLWVTKQHQQFASVIDLTRVEELRRIEHYPQHMAIGAAVPLADAFAALVADRPQLRAFAARFAGLPVRNSGTLGGNVANGSPIGDSMPLLIALGAHVVLMGGRGYRDLPLEKLYTGYRKTIMAADEVLAWIKVPKAAPGDAARVYKISKRYDDDISAVCLAVNLHIVDGRVANASIGAGGVAATPVRAIETERALRGMPWTSETVRNAAATLRAEFAPISDIRASSGYRVQVLGNLLQRYWLESQGMQQINLESFILPQDDLQTQPEAAQ
jgi:xanthine dehydrogenase small subunit